MAHPEKKFHTHRSEFPMIGLIIAFMTLLSGVAEKQSFDGPIDVADCLRPHWGSTWRPRPKKISRDLRNAIIMQTSFMWQFRIC